MLVNPFVRGGIAAVAIVTLFASPVAPLVAGQAPPKTNAPEAFSATAEAKSAGGSSSGMLDVRLNRYTSDLDRKNVEEALRLGGYPRFVTALRKAPEVGQLVLAGGQPYAIRYAREKVEANGRTIVVVTDKPVFFLGASRPDAKARTGFEVAVVQIRLEGQGPGRGTIAAAARVRPDGAGGVLLDDYAETPIELINVTRKPL